MIHSSLKYSSRIETLHPSFKILFDYIKNNDLLNRETGRIELDEDRLYINIIETELIAPGTEILEMHKEYLDIHIPLDTSEIIGWKQTDKCNEINTDYDAEKDYMLYNDKPTYYLTIEPDEFFIVYPEDAHAPLIGKGNIRKLIAKVKI